MNFNLLRSNAADYLAYRYDYNESDPRIAFAITKTDEAVSSHRETLRIEMEADPGQHAQTAVCFKMLAAMGMAYHQKGSAHFGDEALMREIVSGLEYMSLHRYNPALAKAEGGGDWWFKEISCGLALGYCLMLAGDFIPKEQRENWKRTYAAYNPFGYDFATAGWGKTYGVNRLEKCFIYLMLAAAAEDAEMISYATGGMDEVFEYAGGLNTAEGTRGYMDLTDGFYPDGSFLQHVGVAHTGGYGTALLENLPFLLNFTNGTELAFGSERIARICEWARDAYIPVMFRGGVMDFVKDREISRKSLQSHAMGHRIASALCGISFALPKPEGDYFKAVAKGWVAGDTFLDFFSYAHEENQRLYAGATIRMAKLADDDSIDAIYDFETGKVFAVAARAVKFGKGYAFNVAMNSSRNKYYESIHGENLKGWYINEGATAYYDAGDSGHYDGGYWATVDPYRLPGTTVDTVRRADREAASASDFVYSKRDFAGGVALDNFVTAGYQMSAYNVSLTANKSWFMLKDKIVCLGSEITSVDGREIETIIENQKLRKDNAFPFEFVVNGEKIKLREGFSGELKSVKWLHCPWGGYVFPEAENLRALAERRTGDWSAIGNSTGPEENNFLTLWISHGRNPSSARYAYVFLPRASAEETEAAAAKPDFIIENNSADAHAVSDLSTGIKCANVWTKNLFSNGVVALRGTASVMTREADGKIKVAVSDPTWKNGGGIRVEINKRAFEIISSDREIKIESLSPKLIFAAKTKAAASMGRRFEIEAKIE